MKTKLLLYAFTFFSIITFAQNTSIPDPVFEQYLLDVGIDNTGILNGLVPTPRILNVTTLNVSNKNISDLTGIEAFLNLTSLQCDGNLFTSIDISQNINLTSLDCSALTSLNVTQNINLISLACLSCTFTSINLSQNLALKYVDFSSGALTSLNTTNNIALYQLICDYCPITTLNLSSNTALRNVQCQACQLTTLDVSQNLQLYRLWCGGNLLTNLNVTLNTGLYSLWCDNNQISSLNVTQNINLTDLECSLNPIMTLDVTHNPLLNRLQCYNNQLTALNVALNTVLTELQCQNNQISTLNLLQNPILSNLTCDNNILTSLVLTNNPSIYILSCTNNLITSLDLTHQNIPEYGFCNVSNNPFLTTIDLRNGHNTTMSAFDAISCPLLTCIAVDSPALANTYTVYPNNWNKDATATYVSDLNGCFNPNQCWQSVSAKGFCTIAIKGNGTLWSWGKNTNGQLGIGMGSTVNKIIPTQIGTDATWKTISSSVGFTFAIKSNGTLWGWGANAYNIFGSGPFVQNIPIQIGTDSNWKMISSGLYNITAIKTDGTLWAWGNNTYGQLGDGTVIDKPILTQIGTDTDWKFIECNKQNQTFAIKTNGSLWAWGKNSFLLGFGINSNGGLNINVLTPTQIGSSVDWLTISAGGTHCLALKTNGELWSWGADFFGELGNPTIADNSRFEPTRVGLDTNWKKVSAYDSSSLALKTDGSFWGWGRNDKGLLGDGTTIDKNVPTSSNTFPNCQNIFCGSNSFVIKSNGDLVGTGNNTSGTLGNGTTGLSTSTTVFVPINCGTTLGIETLNLISNNLFIYPNPNNGNFYIKNTDISNAVEEIQIYDLRGKLLVAKKIISVEEEIQTSGLSQGLYMINFLFQDGNSLNQKIIIK